MEIKKKLLYLKFLKNAMKKSRLIKKFSRNFGFDYSFTSHTSLYNVLRQKNVFPCNPSLL